MQRFSALTAILLYVPYIGHVSYVHVHLRTHIVYTLVVGLKYLAQLARCHRCLIWSRLKAIKVAPETRKRFIHPTYARNAVE